MQSAGWSPTTSISQCRVSVSSGGGLQDLLQPWWETGSLLVPDPAAYWVKDPHPSSSFCSSSCSSSCSCVCFYSRSCFSLPLSLSQVFQPLLFPVIELVQQQSVSIPQVALKCSNLCQYSHYSDLQNMQCSVVKCSAVQCSAVKCSVAQCSARQCSLLYYSVLSPSLPQTGETWAASPAGWRTGRTGSRSSRYSWPGSCMFSSPAV